MPGYEEITKINFNDITPRMTPQSGILIYGNVGKSHSPLTTHFDYFSSLDNNCIVRNETGLLLCLEQDKLPFATGWTLDPDNQDKGDNYSFTQRGVLKTICQLATSDRTGLFLPKEDAFEDAIQYALTQEVARLDRVSQERLDKTTGITPEHIGKMASYATETLHGNSPEKDSVRDWLFATS
jgi:hypothetical protein